MRKMTSPLSNTEAPEEACFEHTTSGATAATTPHKKEQVQLSLEDVQRRPASTTLTTNKSPFRFPRFGSKTNESKSNSRKKSSPSSATTKQRLRGFPLLRTTTRLLGRAGNGRDVSDTEDMTETPRGGAVLASSSSSTSSTSCTAEAREDIVIKCTKNVNNSTTSAPAPQLQEETETNSRTTEESNNEPQALCSATAILQYSYLETICGGQTQQQQLLEPGEWQETTSMPPATTATTTTATPKRRHRRFPDDPTVQDSIECVFASQLEEGLPLWADDDDEDFVDEHSEEARIPSPVRNIYTYDEEPINAPSAAELPSPATLMQSRHKSRTPMLANALIPTKRRSHPSNNSVSSKSSASASVSSAGSHGSSRPPKAPQTQTVVHKQETLLQSDHQSVKVVHVGTVDPQSDGTADAATTVEVNTATTTPKATPCSFEKCQCHSQTTPILPPELWPQGPVLLRPTPNSGMTIHGIRLSGQAEPFWKPQDGGWWINDLYQLAGKEAPMMAGNHSIPSMCSQCCLLPINNGNEPPGQALVIDFSTPLFEGSMMLRLRHVEGGATSTHPDCATYKDDRGYFAGLNRRYQVVIRGKFRKDMPMTGMVSGLVMDRPAGRLPPKWIVKGAVKVLSFFAPQLEMQLDGPKHPLILAPLGSTPQALVVQEIGPNDPPLSPLDQAIEEPTTPEHSLLNQTYPGNSSLQRARGRKKAFDKLYANKSAQPKTKVGGNGTETYYTFEFLQHLFNFQEFSVELGSLLGSVPIAPIMNGHPLPITAMTKDGHEKLWSFDLWHQSLVKDAIAYDAKQQ
mgnify:CR=1 FL=1